MSKDPEVLAKALEEKAALLRQREQELLAYRRSSERVDRWLRAFYELSVDVSESGPAGLLRKWTELMAGRLAYQTAAVFRLSSKGDLIIEYGEAPGQRIRNGLRALLSERSGVFKAGEPRSLRRFAKAAGFDGFFWFSFESRDRVSRILTAGFPTAVAGAVDDRDRGHFNMLGNHLAALLDRSMLASEVDQETGDLQRTNEELDTSLQDLKKTQEELVTSTRLAAVGAMAGRTAHEVLNPITSIQGRIARMMESHNEVYSSNLELLDIIVRAWHEQFRQGGVEGLCQALAESVGDDAGTLLQDDLAALKSLHQYLGGVDKRYAEGFRFILKELDRVVRIIDGMRSLTRHTASASRVSLSPILQEAAESLSDSLDKRKILLHRDCRGPLEVYLDRYELVQVLTNLMRNAMLAIEDKSGRSGGVIQLAARQLGNRVEIRVMDSGTGIEEAHLPRLFESHFTIRGSESGTGLGLNISRRLVLGFGGELSVEHTEVGVGTTFLIELPAYQPDMEKAEIVNFADKNQLISYIPEGPPPVAPDEP